MPALNLAMILMMIEDICIICDKNACVEVTSYRTGNAFDWSIIKCNKFCVLLNKNTLKFMNANLKYQV